MHGAVLLIMNTKKRSTEFVQSVYLGSHREFWLRNGVDKTCLWKKCILQYKCRQNQDNKARDTLET